MQDTIKIFGAHENNLKGISLEIPKRKITLFTGVSGAGKSSLVFDTIAVEAQRQLSATITNYLPLAGRPDADKLENLTATVVIDQKPVRGNKRSTVGTITDLFSLLRLLFSRIGEPQIGFSNAFSFNEPEGMCPVCEGLGTTVDLDLEKLFDSGKSLKQGAIKFPILHQQWQRYVEAGLFNSDKLLSDFNQAEWDLLLYGNQMVEINIKGRRIQQKYTGLLDTFKRRYIQRDISSLSDTTQAAIDQVTSLVPCPACGGARLNPRALSVKVIGASIAELAALEVRNLIDVLSQIQNPAAAPILSSLSDGLQNLLTLSLGYLTLDRPTASLSAGEAQRIKMVRHLGSSLSDLTYIFDEPTIGLHPRDVIGLNQLIRKFRDLGNTILVVEHDPDVIAIADHVVDLGPGAGTYGGKVVYQGSLAGLMKAETTTGRCLRQKFPMKHSFRTPSGHLSIQNALKHNLTGFSVNIPTGVLTVVTGMAGAGKSSLMEVLLEQHPDLIYMDQTPLWSSSRSITATYTGVMDAIRDQFAQANGVNRSLFSFNSTGACQNCNGLGKRFIELPFMDPVETDCEECQGKRFNQEVLQYTLRGKTISAVLDLTIHEALDFFRDHAIIKFLAGLMDVGLEYLKLGQPLSSFSGGECQRIRLSKELGQEGHVFVLDEPSVGLHRADLQRILNVFNRMVDAGNTLIIVEHNLDIIRNADWVIDLGPEAGTEGGKIVFEGTPKQLLDCEHSYTAQALRNHMP